MERDNASKDQGEEIPHAPPFIQPAVESVKEKNVSPPIEKLKRRVRMARPGVARKGKSICLSTNHFKASVQNINEYFFQYSVNLKYEDDQPVVGMVISRKVVDMMQQIYNDDLGGKELVFDADKTLFTIGPLPEINNEFTVIIDNIQTTKSSGNESPGGNDGDPDERDNNGARQTYQAKIIKVELRFAAKIPMQSIDLALNGEETENTLGALRVLDIILSQHAAKQGCLLVHQSIFHDNQNNFRNLGGSLIGCKGFYLSFRSVQGGLFLNVDVSTTLIVRPGSVFNSYFQPKCDGSFFRLTGKKRIQY